MNEATALNEPSPLSERTANKSEIREFEFPLSRRQTVLLVGLVIVVAVVLWRRRANRERVQDSREELDSEEVEIGQTETQQEERIYVPQYPNDELEKDAVVIEALRDRGKLGES